jgi:hypothetical protein
MYTVVIRSLTLLTLLYALHMLRIHCRCNDCQTLEVTGAQFQKANYPQGAWLCDLCYDKSDFKQCKGCTFYEDTSQQGGGDQGTQTQGTDQGTDQGNQTGGGRRLRGRHVF